MFERLFPRREKHKPSLPQPNAQLALGALLVRVAFADRSYDAREIAAIDRILAQTFSIGPIEAAKLRATCEALERDAPGTSDFARILCEEVSYDARKTLAASMWQVLLADGDHAEIEETMLHQLETALEISAVDSAALKTAATQ
ncbi:MAG: TerB family tellurite resistance protein [Rhodobacteraceae bacterium]|nr:TerB family tellurite resistance protein [Paracoccaceae bacterium]